MIQLAPDHLLFKTTGGESIPCSAELVSIELMGDSAAQVEPEFIKNAAAAVLHYFKNDLGKESVSVGEFSLALERVLHRFGFTVKSAETSGPSGETLDTDLDLLAGESGCGYELLFFPRLRDELRQQLDRSPQMVCFRGLRTCVKKLTGARRWSASCRDLEAQILDYLRVCLRAQRPGKVCSLVVL